MRYSPCREFDCINYDRDLSLSVSALIIEAIIALSKILSDLVGSYPPDIESSDSALISASSSSSSSSLIHISRLIATASRSIRLLASLPGRARIIRSHSDAVRFASSSVSIYKQPVAPRHQGSDCDSRFVNFYHPPSLHALF